MLLTKPNRAEDEIPNTQQNIHDLLSLTNEELEQKSRRIAELEKKLELVELTQVKDMSISQLNASRDYLSTKLGIVIDATNNLNVKT